MATITTRSGKGSPLTHTEGDANFTNLNNDKLENINNQNLGDLANVASTAPTDQQVLQWNNSASEWQPQTASSGASTLVDLTDTSIATPSTGQVLAYTGSNWTNQGVDISTKNIGDLADVQVSAPSDGQVLTYSTANSRFEAQTPSAGGGGGSQTAMIQAGATTATSNFSANSNWTQIAAGWEELKDPDGIVTTSGNTFTLNAGSYAFHVFGPYLKANLAAAGDMYYPVVGLRNTTDTSYPGGWGNYAGDRYNGAQFTSDYGNNVVFQAFAEITGSKTYDLVYKLNTSSVSGNVSMVGYDGDWDVNTSNYKQWYITIIKLS